MTTGRLQVGVDTGGTFTDLVVLRDGALRVAKVSSTPPDFERGIVDAVRSAGIDAGEIGYFAHGTTVTTNAIITKRGARTGLVTTAGFRDVLELRRHNRGDLYDIGWDPPPPLVPRRDRLEVRERTAYDGAEVEPLDEDDVGARGRPWRRRAAGRRRPSSSCTATPTPAHEQRMREALEARAAGRVRRRVGGDPARRSRSSSAPPRRSPTRTSARSSAATCERLGEALQAEGFGGTVLRHALGRRAAAGRRRWRACRCAR